MAAVSTSKTEYFFGKTSTGVLDVMLYIYVDTWLATEKANTSDVTILLQYKRKTEGEAITTSGAFTISPSGFKSKTSELKTITVKADEWVTAHSMRLTVTHNSDGTRPDMYVSASVNQFVGHLAGTEVSGYISFPTVPRATVLDLVIPSTNYFDGAISYYFSPQNANYYSKCVIDLMVGDSYVNVCERLLGVRSTLQQSDLFEFTEEQLSDIYTHLPDTPSGTLRFTMLTYSDAEYSDQVGESNYKEITLSIPNTDATQPTATMVLKPVTTLGDPFDEIFIKGKSKLDADFIDDEGKYGATVVSYSMSVEGKDYADPHITDSYLLNPGKVTVKGVVTDSRGFSRIYTKDITVIDYGAPKIIPAGKEGSVLAARCDSSGNIVDNGTYLKIKAQRSYSKVISEGVQKNFCVIQYRYRGEDENYPDSWTTILAGDASSDEVITGALLDGDLSVEHTYYVQVRAIDDVGEVAMTTITVPTEKVYMHKAGSINSLGIGKYAEDRNTVDIAEDLTVKIRGNVEFLSEEWSSLGLSSEVSESGVSVGRRGCSDCAYLVRAGGKHIFVAFNCSVEFSGAVTVNEAPIPEEHRPKADIYGLCPVSNNKIALIHIDKSGNIIIQSTQDSTEAVDIEWIDGYVDYWI